MMEDGTEPIEGETMAIRKCRSIGEYRLCIEQDQNEMDVSVDIVEVNAGEMSLATNRLQHVTNTQQFEFEGIVGAQYAECRSTEENLMEVCVVVMGEEDLRLFVGEGVSMAEGDESSLSEGYLRMKPGMELQFYDDSQWDWAVIWNNVDGLKKCRDLDDGRVCAAYHTEDDQFAMSVSLEREDE